MFARLIKNYWPQIAITIVIFVFFARLFLSPSIFITPDYGRSDLLHFNIPVKEILSQSLKTAKLPLWETRIGQGYPILDEGQVGALFLPNLLLFVVFPFWLAFDLGYIITFLTSAFGTYLLARSLKLSKTASYLAAITFAFSATFTLHIQHYNLIQTASLMPWLFWLFNEFIEKKRLIFLTLLPLVVSQQIFTGFPQLTFYSLLGLLIFAVYKIYKMTSQLSSKIKLGAFLIFFILLGFLTAAVQLNATYTLTTTSKRVLHNDPAKILTDFPLTTKNLLTIFDPYILGTPQNGSYPLWQPGTQSVFWESNVYFGLIQLLLIASLIPLFILKKLNKQKGVVLFWAGFGLLGLLLALGTDAPLYPIFTFPVFSYFRVPARFIIYVFLAAGILSALALDILSKNSKRTTKILIVAVTVAATLDIFRSWYAYNTTGKISIWLKQPELTAQVKEDERIMNIGQSYLWNSTFLTKGWTNINDYQFYLNFSSQNANITNNKSETLAYAGMSPNRSVIMEGLMTGGIKFTGSQAEITQAAQNMLDETSTVFITTPFPVNSQKWQQVGRVQKGEQNIYLYKNLESLPHAFVAKNYETAGTVQEFIKKVSDQNFNPAETAVLEKEPPAKADSGSGSVEITSYQDTHVTMDAILNSPSLVVLTDSFYPGWEAKIDGQKTEVLAANVNSRAVAVPKGKHTIEYLYKPKRFLVSLVFSAIGLAASLFIILVLKNKKISL